MWRNIRITAEPLDEASLRQQLLATAGDVGALVAFTGLVSRQGALDAVQALELEHYPGMAEAALGAIVAEAGRRWPLQAVLVAHRVGRLAVGEPIVSVLVASRHRGDAFDACRFIMDYLKTDAPFWKKEHGVDASAWVAARDSDTHAREAWQQSLLQGDIDEH